MAPPSSVAKQREHGRCTDALGASPFTKPAATHILVADFYGLQPGDAQFGQSVSEQVSSELRRFEEEELPNFPVHVPTDSLELRRLPCFIDSHDEAERIAAAWGADLVVWGKAYCNPIPGSYFNVQSVEAAPQVSIGGNATASDHAQQHIGTVEVNAPKMPAPYTVCPSATLHSRNAAMRRSAKQMDVMSLGHLDLPTLSSSAPFQLVDFALGLHFYELHVPWVAAWFFKRSVEQVLMPQDAKNASLYGYLSRAYLELPDGQEQAIAYARHALDQVEAQTPMEAFLLSNIGFAQQDQGKYAEAEQNYRRALAIDEKALGPDHPTVATRLNNIGGAQQAQGKYVEAEQNFRRALAIDEKALGPYHPTTAVVRTNLLSVPRDR
jgi:Tetratricopeptide repeat